MIHHLTGRNIRIFFRDPATIFFSLLASIILFVLYAAFLSGVQVDALADQLPSATAPQIEAFVSSWVLGNIVMLTTMTTSLSALAVFVDDRATDRFRDFRVAPVSRFEIIGGYLLGSFILSTVLSLAILGLAQLYLWLVHDAVIGAENVLRSAAYVVGFCLVFSAIWSFVVTFIRSNPVFMSLGTIVGTAGGFLAAAYVTVNQLPTAVVTFINVLPINQAATLMRVPFTDRTIEALAGGEQEIVDTLHGEYGLIPSIAHVEVSEWAIWGVFVALFVVFLALGASRIGRRMG